MAHQWRGVLHEYRDRLDVSDKTPIISLGEGGTPLVYAPALSERTGAKVYVKYEGMNPTGSFKDRGMTMAISKAMEAGAKAVICASTGNTSAAAAAYAAHAGITAAVLVPEGKISMGKLSQAVAHNAEILQLQGNLMTVSTSLETSLRTTPSTSLTRSITTALKDKRRPPSRLSRFSNAHPTSTSSPWGTRATTPPTTAATVKKLRVERLMCCRECSVSRRRARRRSSSVSA